MLYSNSFFFFPSIVQFIHLARTRNGPFVMEIIIDENYRISKIVIT